MIKNLIKISLILFSIALLLSVQVIASKKTSSKIEISWQANREAAVNKTGGGYYVYYSPTPAFNLSKASKVKVPYVSGTKAPTSVVLPALSPGTYYVKVVAYSSLKALSEPSKEVSFLVP